jgi:metal-responsive CopG/Arc/MetJ family transcriptional regulator
MWTRLHIVKTIQVVLDEKTLKVADRAAQREKVNRSALIRKAIALYAARQHQLELERRHRAGYEALPIRPGEFDGWGAVQTWPED